MNANVFFGKCFINTQESSDAELEAVLEFASIMKESHLKRNYLPMLAYHTLFLLFFFSSTRTRTSFEAAMDQLGGVPHDLVPETLQIGHGDTPKEIGKILSSYGHGIAIRHCEWGKGNNYINEVARHSDVPVFNMQCDVHHPFQALADLMTIREKFGRNIKGRKIVMSWAYAKSYSKPLSVPQSFLLLLSRFGADLTLAHPPGFELMPEILEQTRENSRNSGGSLEIVNDMGKAFAGADVVYPKNWGPFVALGDKTDAAKKAIEDNKDWICDSKMMARANKGAFYMHCLPADRGVEVSDEVIDGPQSVVYEQAANRLHVQKAVLALTMSREAVQLLDRK